MKKIDCQKTVCRERLMSPKMCAKGSFRTKRVGSKKAKVVVCCPRGKWRKGRCSVGMKAQTLLRPIGSLKCKKVCKAPKRSRFGRPLTLVPPPSDQAYGVTKDGKWLTYNLGSGAWWFAPPALAYSWPKEEAQAMSELYPGTRIAPVPKFEFPKSRGRGY
jgi:hypothetical protein